MRVAQNMLSGSSVHFIWPRVGSDCYLIEARREFVKNADPETYFVNSIDLSF